MVFIRDQNGTIAGFAPLRTCVIVAHWSVCQLRMRGIGKRARVALASLDLKQVHSDPCFFVRRSICLRDDVETLDPTDLRQGGLDVGT